MEPSGERDADGNTPQQLTEPLLAERAEETRDVEAVTTTKSQDGLLAVRHDCSRATRPLCSCSLSSDSSCPQPNNLSRAQATAVNMNIP